MFKRGNPNGNVQQQVESEHSSGETPAPPAYERDSSATISRAVERGPAGFPKYVRLRLWEREFKGRFDRAASRTWSRHRCAYRKPKPERSDGEVRQAWG
ncbi:MAG: hypothetical protein QOJ15_1658 [Bradyrhizobium sp.]|nr:hypothetical protein [Bradyrhizobium sp.]